ncbi:MAG: hypothetical protein C0399_08175 [Syntrophus sp. (in: bacteria)]|nr:hypothetical protein [Syntrophus sp. (in: bacteria)]
MGFIEKLFGQKKQLEPFPENKSDAEKLNWFKKTQPWDKVDERIIDAIVNKYKGNPMLVVFVVTSMRHGLIPMYCRLNNSEYLNSPDLICSLIAPIFYNLGSPSFKELVALADNISRNPDKFKLHYSIVMDSLETCVILDENQVSAYTGLAMVNRILSKNDDALAYAQKSLDVIKKMKEGNIPFHLSKDENTGNSMQTFEETEKQLKQLIAEIKNV